MASIMRSAPVASRLIATKEPGLKAILAFWLSRN
jgi:hypothetical protein